MSDDEDERRRRAAAEAERVQYSIDSANAYNSALQGHPPNYGSQGSIDGTRWGQQERAARDAAAPRPTTPASMYSVSGSAARDYSSGTTNGVGAGCVVVVLALAAIGALVGAASEALKQLTHGAFILCLWGTYVAIGSIVVALGIRLTEARSTNSFRRWTVAFVGMAACGATTWWMEVTERGLASFARAIASSPASVPPYGDLVFVQLPGLVVLIATLAFGLGGSHRTPLGAFKTAVVATLAAITALTVIVTLGVWRAQAGS